MDWLSVSEARADLGCFASLGVTIPEEGGEEEMAFIKVPMWNGRYLYRCPECGSEWPREPVKEHELGSPPAHDCPKADDIRFDMRDKNS